MARKLVSAALTALFLCVAVTPADSAEWYGTLLRIQRSGSIVIGHRESSIPFSYLNELNRPEGYSIDLCLRIADKIKDVIGQADLRVEYVRVDPKTRIPLLLNGTIDMECGSTTNTLTRQELVDFANTTFISGTKLLVKKGAGIAEVEDLNGKTIALTQGTTNERVIKAIAASQALDLLILPVKDHAGGFEALESGRSVLADLFRKGEIKAIYAKWFDPLGVPPTDLLLAAFQIQAWLN